jgi:hypothetical protein
MGQRIINCTEAIYMKDNISVAVKIERTHDSKGKIVLKAVYPMQIIFDKDYNHDEFNEKIKNYENDYITLINELLKYLKQIHSKKNIPNKVILYWKIGDRIINFINKYKDGVIVPDSLTKTLSRDLNISDDIIQRCKKFRTLYPDISKINKKRSFSSYVAEFAKGYLSRKKKGEKE